MARPVVALLSDFGTRDHYVGTMKGVVLGVCGDASLVDISHEIPPLDVLAGALELGASYRYFPSRTVFLVVVDPGVGTRRRALAAETEDYFFVAPDNGVLTAVFLETPPKHVVELSDPTYARSPISRTFEGRDRFAPAAAWLANHVPLASFGPVITDYHLLHVPEITISNSAIDGEIVRVDRFGNLISNIDRRSFETLANASDVVVAVDGREVPRLVPTYAHAAKGEVCALFGSTDHLEIAVNGGSAAETLNARRGSRVAVARARI